MSLFVSDNLGVPKLGFSSSPKQDRLPTNQEGHRTQFYEHYRNVARGYDKDFIKRHEDDLKTTLIFVSRAHTKLSWTHVNQKVRLVYFPLLPPHSSLRSTPNCNLARVMRLLLSSES